VSGNQSRSGRGQRFRILSRQTFFFSLDFSLAFLPDMVCVAA
jgi:hypothetical protein